MRALITGVQGFVGKYLADHLLSQGIEVWGTSRKQSPLLRLSNGNVEIIQNDLNNTQEIVKLLQSVKPDYIFHLAGQSNVKQSWLDKEGTFYANVNKTIFLLDACVQYQKENPQMRLLTIGSSEEYGIVEPHDLPIKEKTVLRPMSPYGASKATVSMVIQQYHKAHDLNVIHVRPFNHIGPGQSLGFVVPDFVKQIIDIELGISEAEIFVGNLSAARDFMDVRDIVQIYYKLMNSSVEVFGQIFNVCTGKKVTIQEILNRLINLANVEIKVNIDKTKFRPVDVPLYYGENAKIKEVITLDTFIDLDKTLIDTLNYNRRFK